MLQAHYGTCDIKNFIAHFPGAGESIYRDMHKSTHPLWVDLNNFSEISEQMSNESITASN